MNMELKSIAYWDSNDTRGYGKRYFMDGGK